MTFEQFIYTAGAVFVGNALWQLSKMLIQGRYDPYICKCPRAPTVPETSNG